MSLAHELDANAWSLDQQKSIPESFAPVANPPSASPKIKAPLPASRSILRKSRSPPATQEADEAAWGSNFWVTLVDPQTQSSFFACPATGQVSWDPPIGNFVLPPSTEGEWWELSDDSRGGIPYYYQTKTGETVWERPSGFVIPLGIIQNTALGRRLSRTTFDRATKAVVKNKAMNENQTINLKSNGNHDYFQVPSVTSPDDSNSKKARRPVSDERGASHFNTRHSGTHSQLTPIPGSPYATDTSAPPSPAKYADRLNGKSPISKRHGDKSSRQDENTHELDLSSRTHKSIQLQSLQVAVEMLTTSENGESIQNAFSGSSIASSSSHPSAYLSIDYQPSTPTKGISPLPSRLLPSTPYGRSISAPTVAGKGISAPIPDHAATMQLSPVKNRAAGSPIPVHPIIHISSNHANVSLISGTHPTLPDALVTDIQQFSESDYAKQYFSTHRSGFIFRRKVPVEQLMTWQKMPMSSPLLVMNRTLHKDAVKMFKIIQRIMGDRDKEKLVAIRMQPENHISMASSINASSTSLAGGNMGILEEERWLLGEGLIHGELRDEIYCQLMKQLTGNSSTESVFKGWQLLCVLLITFPPSKNFETYLKAFIQKHTSHQEGRVDVIAKCCIKRLASISKKGPRGKPPTIAEIETASDAAFNPSTFGESLDAIVRLQERNYPHQKVPIILPFLADGILALGGAKVEGIFRVPGDSDSVSELKLRIDRGYYTLDGVDDPHVLASLLKLWLRELCDPLVPEEMYNECILGAKDPEACIQIVEHLPTINRRVVLFVISFFQLFLEERTQNSTKMTPANLALVMAPNLIRCSSDSMSIVFTNAQYEQIFVYNLLLHLRCDKVDPHYIPAHGMGAVKDAGEPKQYKYKSSSRRHKHGH